MPWGRPSQSGPRFTILSGDSRFRLTPRGEGPLRHLGAILSALLPRLDAIENDAKAKVRPSPNSRRSVRCDRPSPTLPE
jgi:hypothetical protein